MFVRERTFPHGSLSACAGVEKSIIHVRFGVRVFNVFNRVHCRCVPLLSKEMMMMMMIPIQTMYGDRMSRP